MPWDFDEALADPLVRVVNRIDEMGTFEIQIGDLETIITIELGRLMDSDETKVSVTHAIHTPVQIGPYRPSRPYWDDPEYALSQTISSLTDHYERAVNAGHQPQESWLVPY